MGPRTSLPIHKLSSCIWEVCVNPRIKHDSSFKFVDTALRDHDQDHFISHLYFLKDRLLRNECTVLKHCDCNYIVRNVTHNDWYKTDGKIDGGKKVDCAIHKKIWSAKHDHDMHVCIGSIRKQPANQHVWSIQERSIHIRMGKMNCTMYYTIYTDNPIIDLWQIVRLHTRHGGRS